jgi:hypothetical protein
VIALLVCAFAAAHSARAQTPAPEGWVVLPIDEYRSLRSRATPDPPPPIAPPVDAVLTRVEYELRVEGDTVAGRATLTVDVLKDGWAKVAIPAGLLVRDARLDGQPLPLVAGPPAHVVLSRAGRAVLALEVSIPLATSAGTESISLPASPAPISRASLMLPRGGVEVTVAGGFITDRSESATESRWTALGRANQPLAFTWKRRADDRRAQQPLRFRARVATVVGLGEEISTLTSAIRVDVQQGVARDITVALPRGVAINQVNGASVADWEVTSGLLRVRFLDPVIGDVSFVAVGESRLPADGEIGVPLVRVPAAERESGGVAIGVLGAGEIERHQMRGLEPADVSELSDVAAGRESPSMVAFRFRPSAGSEARLLNLSVKRYTPQAVLVANIEEARYRALAADGLYLVEGHYAVRNNQRSFLKVSLPPGATMWGASVAGKPVRPGAAEAGAVLLALAKGREGEDAPTFVVRLTYLQHVDAWSDRVPARLVLPALDLPVSRTGVEIHYSPLFRIAVRPGPFREEPDPGVFAEALRGPQRGVPMPLPAPAAPPVPVPAVELDGKTTQLHLLIERYRNEGGGRTVSGALPVEVSFPTLGPSIFVAAELTAEAQAPAIDLAIRRIK